MPIAVGCSGVASNAAKRLPSAASSTGRRARPRRRAGPGPAARSRGRSTRFELKRSLRPRRRGEGGACRSAARRVVFTRRAWQSAGPRFGTSIVRVRRPRANVWLETRVPLQTTSARALVPARVARLTVAVKVTRRPGPSRPNGSVCRPRAAIAPLRLITSGPAAGVSGIVEVGWPPSSASSAALSVVVRRREPRDRELVREVDPGVVLGEDLGDAPAPAARVVERDAALVEELLHPALLPPHGRAVQLGHAGDAPVPVDVVSVLVQERARDAEVLACRDDDQPASARPRVASLRARAAKLPDALLRDDPRRHLRDLVAVRGRAQEPGVPVDVDVRRLDVERDRAALVVLPDGDLGAGAGRDRKRRDQSDEEEGEPAPSRREVVDNHLPAQVSPGFL